MTNKDEFACRCQSSDRSFQPTLKEISPKIVPIYAISESRKESCPHHHHRHASANAQEKHASHATSANGNATTSIPAPCAPSTIIPAAIPRTAVSAQGARL
ncbi:hypothetical protein BJX70DRAFT_355890 [Aspergillus crustosus]